MALRRLDGSHRTGPVNAPARDGNVAPLVYRLPACGGADAAEAGSLKLLEDGTATQPIYDDVTRTVGHTPLVKLNRLTQGLDVTVAVKLESRNPLGSVKDRIAVNMIDEAEKTGKVGPGTVIVESTSGNTGIGLAFVCAARGYELILTMRDDSPPAQIVFFPVDDLVFDEFLYAFHVGGGCSGEVLHDVRLVENAVQGNGIFGCEGA